MTNLLAGNGFLIQFGGKEYTNKEIVLRTLENFEKNDFPTEIIVNTPVEAKSYFGILFNEIIAALQNEYDKYCNCSSERVALNAFKKKYSDKKSLQISDIGFEDYYLFSDLICHKCNIGNPEQFHIRESLKSAFLHSIYNSGKIENIYKHFSESVVNKLKSYDFIFTTNYDNNIEKSISKEVYHIHGCFYDTDDIYNSNSLRNQLSDSPIKDCIIDDKFFYLYSTAISFHCGEYKEMHMNQGCLANKAVEKIVNAYEQNNRIRENIESWKHNSNSLVAKLYEIIQIKRANPDIHFSEPYHIDYFKSMSGHLDIIGLSPNNDFHIFEMINNSGLSSITYYFYDNSECDIISQMMPNKSIEFKDVKKLWEELK